MLLASCCDSVMSHRVLPEFEHMHPPPGFNPGSTHVTCELLLQKHRGLADSHGIARVCFIGGTAPAWGSRWGSLSLSLRPTLRVSLSLTLTPTESLTEAHQACVDHQARQSCCHYINGCQPHAMWNVARPVIVV